MKLYAVIDTNVIVSALLKHDSVPGQIVDQATNGKITPVLSTEIIGEYISVINRNKFGFQKDVVDDVLSKLEKHALFLDRTKTEDEFIDLDDVMFYEVVLSARDSKGDAYLVTGNMKHFPARPFVVTPTDFIEIIKYYESK